MKCRVTFIRNIFSLLDILKDFWTVHLSSGIWVLTADFWKNLLTFCHRNSRSELRCTPKSTIMKLPVLSVPRSCTGLLLFQSAQFFQKLCSYVVTSVNKKSQKSYPRFRGRIEVLYIVDTFTFSQNYPTFWPKFLLFSVFYCN